MPDFKPATSDFVNPVRPKTGQQVQKWSTFYATHDGGIYQQVANVQTGQSYCFSVWGQSWSSYNDNGYTDPSHHGFLNQMIGIDPFGGTDWTSSNIIWTVPSMQYDEYGLFKLSAVAQANQLTVFMRANPLFPAKHNDVYWDDAILVNESSVAGSLSISQSSISFSAETNAPRQQSADLMIQLTNASSSQWFAQTFPEAPFAIQLNQIDEQTLRITADSAGLAAGVHKGYIKIQAADPLIPPQQIEIILTVTQSAEASMSIDRNTFIFSADTVTPTIQTGELTIELNNVPNFQWFAWLSPESNFQPTLLPTIGNSSNKKLSVIVNSEGLSAGEYTAYLRIGASDPTILGGNVTVTIKLLVKGSAETLTVDGNWFNLSAESTDTIQTLEIPIQLHNVDSSVGWQASVDPTSHFIPQLTRSTGKSGESLGVIIDARPLAPGNYTAKVIVATTTLNRQGSVQEIVIQLTVQPPPPPPTLLLGDVTYRYVTSTHFPFLLSQKIPMVIAYGKEEMHWIVRPSTNNLSDEQAWTPELGLTKGESGGYLTWQIDPSRLALGSYTAELEAEIDDPALGIPPVKIKIEVVVTDIRPIFLPVIVR